MTRPHTESRAEVGAVEKVWRDGPRLVLHETKAVLPRRCVACNAPTDGRLTRVRVSERISALVFCLLFLLFIWGFAFVRRVRLRLGLCEHHRQRN